MRKKMNLHQSLTFFKWLYHGITLLHLAPSGGQKLTFLKPKNSHSEI